MKGTVLREEDRSIENVLKFAHITGSTVNAWHDLLMRSRRYAFSCMTCIVPSVVIMNWSRYSDALTTLMVVSGWWIARVVGPSAIWQGGDHCPVLLCKERAQRLSEPGTEDWQLRNVTDAMGSVA